MTNQSATRAGVLTWPTRSRCIRCSGGVLLLLLLRGSLLLLLGGSLLRLLLSRDESGLDAQEHQRQLRQRKLS